MITALIEQDDRIAGFKLGADDYIAKPFDIREMACALKLPCGANDRASASKRTA